MIDAWRSRCGSCDWGHFDAEEFEGVCRKHPPTVVVIDDAPETVWPVVYPHDWCAVYTPRRERPWTVQASAQGDGSGS